MNKSKRISKNKNHGFLLFHLSRFFEKISKLAAKSVILSVIFDYTFLRKKCSDSVICGKFSDLSTLKQKFLKFKVRCAAYAQQCYLLYLFKSLIDRFYQTNLRSLGIFFFSFGGFLVSLNFAEKMQALINLNFSDTFIFGSVLVIISFFLFPLRKKNIACCLYESKFLSSILFDLFSVNQISPAECSVVLPTSGFSLIFGIACGFISYYVSPLLTGFIIFMIFVIYLVFIRPENGILLTCLVLPFANQKILYFMISITIVSALFKIIRGKRAFYFGISSGTVSLLCIIGLSGFINSFDSQSADSSLVYELLTFAFALCVPALVKSSSFAEKCYKMLIFSVVLTCLYGFYNYAMIYFVNRDFSDILRGLLTAGMNSSFQNTSIFAAFLICTIPMLFSKANTRSGSLPRIVSILPVICLILTNSYLAVLSLLIAVIVTILIFYRYGLLLTGGCVALIYLLKPLLPSVPLYEVQAYFKGFNSPYVIPSTYYNGIFDFFRNFWFYGAGAGSDSIAAACVVTDAQITGYSGIGATYVKLAMKYGFLLFILCLILVFALFLRIISCSLSKTTSEFAKNRCVLLFCGIVALAIYALFTDIFTDFRIALLLIFLLTLGNATADSAENDYISPYFEREYL